MNKERREELNEAIEYLVDACDVIEQVHEEEEEAFDNLPEGFQNGSTGESMQMAMDKLEDFVEQINIIINDMELFIKNKKPSK